MNLIDTHAHIYLEEFDNDRALLFERAEKERVDKIYLPAIDSTTHLRMLDLEAAYPQVCRSMIGVHPCYIKDNYTDELAIVRTYLEQRAFAAVGEIGLDFYWDTSFTDQQYAAFHQQVEWALEFDVPIAIHSRNATDECIAVVAQHQQGKLKGVFHCFSGTIEQAQKIMDLGFYLGIGGVISFKNGGLDKVIQAVGLDKTILETDAPYLAPVPFRGKRNEPAYLKYVVEKLADVCEKSHEEVATITTANATALFEK